MQTRVTFSATKGLLLLLAVCFLANLSYVCWQLSQASSPSASANEVVAIWNPFYSEVNALERDIEIAEQEVRRSFEFMTFAQDRENLARQLLRNHHKRINLQPFNGQYWIDLLELEREANIGPRERLWSMESALTISGWQRSQRALVTAECLIEPPRLVEFNPDLCRRLINSLPYPSLTQNASMMGVDWRFLQRRIESLKQRYGTLPVAGSDDD